MDNGTAVTALTRALIKHEGGRLQVRMSGVMLGLGTLTRCARHIQPPVNSLHQGVVYERGGES
jgi:hypothetical protein